MRINTSTLVPSQLPEFVRTDYDTFIAFIQAYYEYLDNQGLDFLTLRDLDETLDKFLVYFKDELANNLPTTVQVDYRTFLKNMKDLYLAKGSPASYKLLFKILYGKNVTVSYPGTQMLRASDGKWQQDVSIFVNVSLGTPDMIAGKLVDVITPTATFKILVNRQQNVEVEIDRIVQISANVYEIFIDRNFFGAIAPGDVIQYKTLFSGQIVATTSSLQVVSGGTNFKAGQLFELKNGAGVKSIIKVTRVDAVGKILSAEFIKFGINYNTDFSITINSNNDYFTQTNASLLTTETLVPGGVNITDAMAGFQEDGYISTVDYVVDSTYATSDTTDWLNAQYWDGSYAGNVLREYSVQPQITLSTTALPATFKVILGAVAKYPGYYSSNDGFLDDAIFIQDSRYYQAFSYVLQSTERLDTYKSVIRSLLHPSGTALFGEFQVTNTFNLAAALQSLVKALALTLQDSVAENDGIITFFTTKVLSESQPQTDSTTIYTSKALSETISTPSDATTLLTTKVFAESQPQSDSATITTTKPLTESVSPTDVYAIETDKVFADSVSESDTTVLYTAKYLTETESPTDNGYVALDPYSLPLGEYAAITPIFYDNSIQQTF
jgi:hypothetical protein